MANPQTENGHIRIANDLWEAWCRVGTIEDRVFKALIRLTWGWGEKGAQIPHEAIMQLTGVRKPAHITRATDALEAAGFIRKVTNPGKPSTYSINKDYDVWTITTGGNTPQGNTLQGKPSKGITGITLQGKGGITLQGKPDTLYRENKEESNIHAAVAAVIALWERKKPCQGNIWRGTKYSVAERKQTIIDYHDAFGLEALLSRYESVMDSCRGTISNSCYVHTALLQDLAERGESSNNGHKSTPKEPELPDHIRAVMGQFHCTEEEAWQKYDAKKAEYDKLWQ